MRFYFARSMRFFVFLLIFMMFFVSSAISILADDIEEVDPGQITFREQISEIQNEKIDPYTGELSLSYTDLTLPGKGGLDLAIVRTYQANRKLDQMPLGLRWDTPLGLRWDIHMGRIMRNGFYVNIELHDGTKNTAVKVDTSNSKSYYTKDFWKVDLSNVPFLQLPDGTKIEFNHAYLKYWYATKISKNGNEISITYKNNSRDIDYIIDTLGHQIHFEYAPMPVYPKLTTIYCFNSDFRIAYNRHSR